MKRIIALCMLGCVAFASYALADNTVSIRTTLKGFEGENVYFDFIEEPEASMEFPFRKDMELDFITEVSDVSLMKINAWVWVFVMPGDDLDITITYKGRRYEDVEIKGASAESIAATMAVHRMRTLRSERRYKTNIPAALALQTPPDEYFVNTIKQWKDEMAILDEVKGQLSEKMYNFVRSNIDALFLPNIIQYPGHVDQPGYWEVFNDYTMRDDKGSLRSHVYMGTLGIYKDYMRHREAHLAGKEYKRPTKMTDEYADVAAFYEGDLRDAALFVLLYNLLARGGDFDVIEGLVNDYNEKYNINPFYKKMLMDVMK